MVGRRRTWLVEFDAEVVRDFDKVKSRGDRAAVLNVVQKLQGLGPRLSSPHMKSLKGESDLFELRPKQGATAVRPIYARLDDRFVVLAIAPNKREFDRALRAARTRLAFRFLV